jgi:uncharacterized membrane-anchored protein YitT (DUF2179 family)
MEITQYLIIGVAVSMLVQWLKTKYGTDSNKTLLVVLGLSIVTGTVYYFIKDTNYYQTILSILAMAGAFYTYILQRFEK